MHMNPKMDVPVLRNDTLVVPSSNQIINYLEANFNGTALLPRGNRNHLNKVVFLNRKISQIPIGIISLGTFIHPDIVSAPKLPFVGPLRQSFLGEQHTFLDGKFSLIKNSNDLQNLRFFS